MLSIHPLQATIIHALQTMVIIHPLQAMIFIHPLKTMAITIQFISH